MTMVLTTAARNEVLDDGLDVLFDEFRIYSGTRPSGPDKPFNTATDVTLLASITLPDPFLAAAGSGARAKTGTWQDSSANATGTATWGRFVKSSDTDADTQTEVRADVDVAESAADAIIDNDAINSGQVVTVTAFTFTLPSGA